MNAKASGQQAVKASISAKQAKEDTRQENTHIVQFVIQSTGITNWIPIGITSP